MIAYYYQKHPRSTSKCLYYKIHFMWDTKLGIKIITLDELWFFK